MCAPDGLSASVAPHPTMSPHVLERLNPSLTVLKRAQYEAFSFALHEGDVLVRNESHADPRNHEYRVRIRDGLPASCECPADRYHTGPCKHRVAVAIRKPVLDAARTMHSLQRSSSPSERDPNESSHPNSA